MTKRPKTVWFWGLCSAAVLVYLAAARFALPRFMYQINPDAVSYISIARKYLAGNFDEAINGYWSPMISWLLVPLLAIDQSEPLRAAKLVCIGSGCILIVGTALLCRSMRLRTGPTIAVLIGVIPVVLVMAVSVITPDLLVAGLLTVYLAIVIGSKNPRPWREGLWCGLLGAAAFTAKSFALPFFICYQTVGALVGLVATRSHRRAVLRNYIVSMLVCLLISGVWVGLMSNKYRRLTISSAAKLNRARRHPDPEKKLVKTGGFVVPPNSTAVYYTEDRTHMKVHGWSSFKSSTNLKHQLWVSGRNVRRIIRLTGEYSLLTPVVMTVCLILCVRQYRRLLRVRWLVLSLLAVVVYCGGYAMMLVVSRYLWPIWILLMVLSGALVSRSFSSRLMRNPTARVIALLALVLFWTVPTMQMLDKARQQASEGWKTYDLSRKVRQFVPPGGRIASNLHVKQSLYLAFHLDCQFLGTPDREMPDEQVREHISELNIKHFLMWDPSPNRPAYLVESQEVTGDLFPFLDIHTMPSAPLPPDKVAQ